MSVHQKFIKQSVCQKMAVILKELQAEKTDRTSSMIVKDVREKEMVIDEEDVMVKRLYVRTFDSGAMANVGWVVNDGIKACLECSSSFGLLTGRHHCRSCGNLVCQRCSPNRNLILDFEILGAVRICNGCMTTNSVGPIVLHNNEKFGVSVDEELAVAERELAARLHDMRPTLEEASIIRNLPPPNRLSLAPTSTHSDTTDEEILSPEPELIPVIITVPLPVPGFVIKTKQSGGEKSKVFVNVFHHDQVEDPELTLFTEPQVVGKDGEDGQSNRISNQIVPNILLGRTVSTTVDKEGRSSELYNVVINSEYFTPSSVHASVKVTDAVAVQKILRVINKHYGTAVREDMFLFPNIKTSVKGEPVADLPCVRNTHAVDISVTKVLARSDSFASVSTIRTAQSKSPSFSISAAAQHDKRRSLRNSLLSTMGLSTHEIKHDEEAGEQHPHATTPPGTGSATGANRRFTMFSSKSNLSEVTAKSSLLSPSMMMHIDAQSVSAEEAARIKEASVEDTKTLLGWQILIPSSSDEQDDKYHDKQHSGKVFVVTDISKTALRKTEFRLSSLHSDDIWVKLKRNSAKMGLEFTPLRKVLFLNSNSPQEANSVLAE